MIRSARFPLALIVIASVCVIVPASARQATFRTSTESTWITATVIDKDGRLVTDVRQSDFQVFENGEPRTITAFRNDTVPFSIAITIDTSLSMFDNLGWVRRGVNELVKRFEPGDRANIGTFAAVPLVSPRFSGSVPTLLSWVSATIGGGAVPCHGEIDVNSMMRESLDYRAGTAVWDALGCAITTAAADSETPRRVALIVTDGKDHISHLKPIETLALAEQYGVMVYAITAIGEEGMDANGLRGIAEATGGGYFYVHNAMDLPNTFAQLAEELRHQYVFGFTSSDPKSKIEVKTSRAGSKTRSRRASLIVRTATTSAPAPVAAAGSPVAAPPPPAAPPIPLKATSLSVMTPVIYMLDSYARGEWLAADAPFLAHADLVTAVGQLKRGADEWIRAEGPLDEQRRRLALGAFVLEFLEHEDDNRYWIDGEQASDLLEWTCAVLRNGPAAPAEREWHIGAAALLERFKSLAVLRRHVKHAQSRFPKDPRWPILEGILAELVTWPQDHGSQLAVDSGTTLGIVNKLKDAAKVAPVASEALLRLGFFELRRGQTDEAIARFTEAGRSPDADIRYLLHLLRGRALERVNRRDDAVLDYRAALIEFPFAQSATLALGTALAADGRVDEAAALMSQMLAIPAPAFDPWTLYAVPDWRFWPGIITTLRQAVRP